MARGSVLVSDVSPVGASMPWRPAPHDPGTTELESVVGADNVLRSVTDLIRYSADASPYRLVPRVVVVARDGRDVAGVFRFATRTSRRIILRAAGTSLNGQSQGDDILLDVRRHFDNVTVEDEGHRLRAESGAILARANARVARFGRILGPDPASSAAACVGGVIANNASGMACGVRHNSYNTVESMRLVLPSGTRVDTAATDADERLAHDEPELHGGTAGAPRRDSLRSGAERADPVEVRDQEHQWLPPGRFPRLGYASRHPAWAPRRVARHARLRRGRDLPHHSARTRAYHRLPALRQPAECGIRGAHPDGARCTRRRAPRQPLDPVHSLDHRRPFVDARHWRRGCCTARRVPLRQCR